MNNFKEIAQKMVLNRKRTILLIPNKTKVKSEYLEELSNEQFVAAFRDLQKIVIKIYEDIEKSPFDWGYPDFEITEGYYHRVTDFLLAFVLCGVCNNGILTINMKPFLKYSSIKRHKKQELMITGFNKIGFLIEGFNKKSLSFTFTYPKNPNIIIVLNEYVHALGENSLHWSAQEMCKWNFSYRFIEDSAMQKYETVFHSKMDLASENLRKIQNWLHEEAEKYGYKIDVSHPYEKNCIQYQKGSKIFLLVGEKEIKNVPAIFSKVIFRNVFANEKEKIMELNNEFPDTFKSNCNLCNGSKQKDSKCSMRICYDIEEKHYKNCAYKSFYFYNPTIDCVKNIMNLFLIENNIKKI